MFRAPGGSPRRHVASWEEAELAQEFIVPDVGEGLTQITVLKWLVEVGSPVAMDEPLVEVETDKAVVDIPSPFPGTLLYQGAHEGEEIEVGAILAVVGEAGEEWAPATDESPAVEAAPIVGTLPPASVGSGTQALPAVRKLADELGVDLNAVEGSGEGGRITAADVEDAAGAGRRETLSRRRRAIADHLSRSWREIPHVTTFGSARAESLLAERARLLAEAEGPMPLEALLISAILPLLVEYPDFNASLAGSDVLYRDHYHIGVATNTDDGLVVPVVADADRLSIHELADVIIRLGKSARGGKLTPDDVRGATFTVSNIGAVGGGYGTPIIPLGTTAIISFGRAEDQPVVEDGSVVVGKVLPISLSYDHRLIDGAQGRAFMAAVVDRIEA